MTGYRAPAALSPSDDLSDFRSRSSEQTDWIRRLAHQSSASGETKVFVVRTVDEGEVVAYYAWRMAQLELADAPARLRRGAGRYPQPVALLARLAVDERHEGYGLGAALLLDVIRRMADLSERIGCRGLLIHAESVEARSYLHLVPELMASPTDDLHLVLLRKDAVRTLAALG